MPNPVPELSAAIRKARLSESVAMLRDAETLIYKAMLYLPEDCVNGHDWQAMQRQADSLKAYRMRFAAYVATL